MHICAKQNVGKDLFSLIWDRLADADKKSLIVQTDIEDNTPFQMAVRADKDDIKNNYLYQELLKYIDNNSNQLKEDKFSSSLSRIFQEIAKNGCINILTQMCPVPEDGNKTTAGGEQATSTEDKQKKTITKAFKQLMERRSERGYTCLHLAAAKGK